MPGFFSGGLTLPDRVMVFIDGSNFSHALKATYGTGKYDVVKLGRELASGRSLIQINSYIAQVNRAMGEALYSDQQRFFTRLRQVPEIRLWTGRMARTNTVWYEKGLDVQIATHLMAMAYRDESEFFRVSSTQP